MILSVRPRVRFVHLIKQVLAGKVVVHMKSPLTLLAATVIGLVFSSLAQAASGVAVSAKEILAKSIRYPAIVVPMVDKPPTIDGVVDADEWSSASLISDLVYSFDENDKRFGLPSEYRCRYWMQYDKDAIYVAFRFDLPS